MRSFLRLSRVPWVMFLLGMLIIPSMAQELRGSDANHAPVRDPVNEEEGGVAGDEMTSGIFEDALDVIPEDEPRMEAYSHGNYTLFLVGSVWSLALLVAIVFTGFGSTLQRMIDRLTRGSNRRVAAYAALFTLVTYIGTFPLTIYGGFWREKQYGFANQTLIQWMADQGKALLLSVLLMPIFYVVLYIAIRRMGRRWWLAGSVISVVFMIIIVAVAPVFIDPIFNTYTQLEDTALRDDILEMARKQGIPAGEVYQVDASRQTRHNNAYVKGLLGTQRIVLYDTLLRRFSPREILFVMGHEMGHYVLRHIWRTIGFLSVIVVVGFFLVDRVSRRVIASRPRLGIANLAEPASLPLLILVFNLFSIAAAPAITSLSRAHERQADRFGLEVTRDPLAAASSFMKFAEHDLSEYDVHPWIEFLLFSHPSLSNRIRHAQEWARHEGPGED